MGLILLIVVLAILGGFLGTLLEFTFWAILIMVAVGALLGFLAYRAFTGLSGRSRS